MKGFPLKSLPVLCGQGLGVGLGCWGHRHWVLLRTPAAGALQGHPHLGVDTAILKLSSPPAWTCSAGFPHPAHQPHAG